MKTLLIPRQVTGLDSQESLPFGMTHLNDTPCPFANDKLPTGFINTCCSFCSAKVVEDLARFGHVTLAALLTKEATNEKLPYIAKELRRAADALPEQYVEPGEDEMSQRGGVRQRLTDAFVPLARQQFEESLALIRKAADWFEKVGHLGFDVGTWY